MKTKKLNTLLDRTVSLIEIIDKQKVEINNLTKRVYRLEQIPAKYMESHKI